MSPKKKNQKPGASPGRDTIPGEYDFTKASASSPRKCGLCGKKTKLVRTECCNNWICDDEDSYVLFSYSRNSCARNHRRYTLCGYHRAEEHDGEWQTCNRCREDIETEMYVYYGTNEYNFVKLQDPPRFEPTRCANCHRVIRLAQDPCTISQDKYYCGRCMPSPF
jgi:hypothetical protein